MHKRELRYNDKNVQTFLHRWSGRRTQDRRVARRSDVVPRRQIIVVAPVDCHRLRERLVAVVFGCNSSIGGVRP